MSGQFIKEILDILRAHPGGLALFGPHQDCFASRHHGDAGDGVEHAGLQDAEQDVRSAGPAAP